MAILSKAAKTISEGIRKFNRSRFLSEDPSQETVLGAAAGIGALVGGVAFVNNAEAAGIMSGPTAPTNKELIQVTLNRAMNGRMFEQVQLPLITREAQFKAGELAKQEQAEVDALTFSERWNLSHEANGLTRDLVARFVSRTQIPTDPAFVLDSNTPIWEELTKGLPPEFWPHFAKSRSLQHAFYIRDEIMSELDAREKLEMAGFGTNMLALFDPILIGTMLLSPNYFAKYGQASRLIRGLGTGVTQALQFGAYETALTAAQFAKPIEDVAHAMAGALVFGGVVGSLLPPVATVASATALKKFLKRSLSEDDDFLQADMARSLRLAEDETMISPAPGTNKRIMAPRVVTPRVVTPKVIEPKVVEPQVVEPRTVGAAERAGAEELAPDVTAAEVAVPQLKGPMAWMRWGMYGVLAKSPNALVRNLGGRLVHDSVGDPVGHVTATEWATVIKRNALVKFRQGASPALDEFLKGVPMMQRAAKQDEFFESVTKKVIKGEFDDSPVGRAAKAFSESVEFVANEAKRVGVKGFDGFETRAEYVPHIINNRKLNTILEQFGEKEWIAFFSKSIRQATGWSSKVSGAVAKAYIHNVRVRGAGVNEDFFMKAIDLDDITAMMRQAGITDQEVATVVGKIKAFNLEGSLAGDVTKAGKMARARRRLQFDETMVGRLRDKSGEMRDVTVLDMFETNSVALAMNYISSVGGHIGLAKVGIRSLKEWDELIDTAKLHELDAVTRNKARFWEGSINKDVENLHMIHDHLMGRPLIDYGDTMKMLGHFGRDLGFITQSGGFGVAQLPEMFSVANQMGLKMIIDRSPEFAGFIRRAQNGKLENALAAEIEEYFGGMGTDALLHSFSSRFDFGFDELLVPQVEGLLAKTEFIRHGARKYAGYLSGLTPITVGMQRFSTVALAQRAVNQAFGAAERGLSEARMLSFGWNKGMQKRIMDGLRKYSSTHKSAQFGNKLHRLNLEKWVDDLEARDAFIIGVRREATSTVIVPDISTTPPWMMNSEIAKILGQFMGFAIAANEKLLLRSFAQLNRFDAERVSQWIGSMGVAALGYVSFTHLGSLGLNSRDRRKFLKERLSPERIAAASFNRSGFSALLPPAIDTGLSLAGQDQIFNMSRSSGLLSGASLDATPMGTIVKGAETLVRAPFDGKLTKQEWRKIQKLIPIYRMFAIKSALDYVGQDLPEER